MVSNIFTEKQSIPSNMRLMIFGGVTLLVAFIGLMTYLTEWNTMPADEKTGMLTLLIAPVATLIVFIIRLDVRMTSKAIEYKSYPFSRRYKVIPLSNIAQIELTRTKKFSTHRGIGTHKSFRQTEMNYGGKYVVRLMLQNGRIISFTTNKPQELKDFLLNLPEGSPMIKASI